MFLFAFKFGAGILLGMAVMCVILGLACQLYVKAYSWWQKRKANKKAEDEEPVEETVEAEVKEQ